MLYNNDKCHYAGQIKDFLIEGSNLQGWFGFVNFMFI